MTREELKNKFTKTRTRVHSIELDGTEVLEILGTEIDIDGIIEYFESRTCESCKHLQNIIDENEISCSYHCSFFDKDFCCNRYEPKDRQ